MSRKTLQYLPLFTLGLSSITTQVIFLRKFLDVFYGNELIIGIILTNWMLLSGMGAWFSSRFIKNNPNSTSKAFLLLAFIPLITVLCITAGRVWLFPSGTTLGLLPVFLFSLILQIPFCLVSGALFPILTSTLNNDTDFTLSQSYLAESLGSFLGVIFFNTLLLYVLPDYAILFLLFLVNFYQAWDIYKPIKSRYSIYYFGVIFFIFFLAISFFAANNTLNKIFYQHQKILESKESPYGNLVVTESSGQKNFYENGLPLFNSNDAISREESVHYAMLQHSCPKKVLLVSGGLSGLLNEILKYPVERIDYLEMNPWILKLGSINGLIPNDARINIINADARLYLRSSKEQYDIVLLQLPDPVTAQINRYFTHEFFRGLLRNLSQDAVVCISLRSTADYMSPISREINSLLYNSLSYSFKHVVIIPGARNYFLASDAELTVKLAGLAEKRGISTQYVNSAYLQDDLLSSKSKEIQGRIDEKAGLNRDFQPRVYFEETKLWLSAFNTPWWIVAIIVIPFMIFYFLRSKKPQISLFVTGFTSAALSFLLMMAFQSLFGYLYLMTALIISIFMLGIGLGCLLHRWLWTKGYAPAPAWNQIYLGGFVLLLLMALLGHKSITHSVAILTAIFLVLSLLNGFFTGMQFSAVGTESEEIPGKVASQLYSADLIGSALGMLAVSAFFFPLGGLIWVCLALGLINFVVGFVMF